MFRLMSEVGFCSNHGRLSQRYVTRIGALMLLLVMTLITILCGTVAQASGRYDGGLVLSGALPVRIAVNQSYNAVLSVSGGNSPYQFSVVSGVLPPGVSLNSKTGSFTGQPTTAGNYTFVVGVTDKPNSGEGRSPTWSPSRKVAKAAGSRLVSLPSNATLSSGGTQQFTATVTGTSNTAVTWSATAGSIGSNGLYTAPVVNSTSYATVTATSQEDSSQSASAAVTINPLRDNPLSKSLLSSLPHRAAGTNLQRSFLGLGRNATVRLEPDFRQSSPGNLAECWRGFDGHADYGRNVQLLGNGDGRHRQNGDGYIRPHRRGQHWL